MCRLARFVDFFYILAHADYTARMTTTQSIVIQGIFRATSIRPETCLMNGKPEGIEPIRVMAVYQ
ncbi:MAG: hypothetical protein BGP19_16045 [Thiobacillus sp. 0-1251]|nr:MAG: hypothetical protein BGP19_16045 [Thiobacillus sp. 0-1251]